MMPQDPVAARRSTEFGAAYSSSQRRSDTIGNTPPPGCQSSLVTPAGSPPPAGVIVFRMANRKTPPPFPASPLYPSGQAYSLGIPAELAGRHMQYPHACHAARPYRPAAHPPIWSASVGRRSPPPASPTRSAIDSPPGPPIETSDARRTSSPAGVAFSSGNALAASTTALWRPARKFARILPKFLLDMHKTHSRHTAISL